MYKYFVVALKTQMLNERKDFEWRPELKMADEPSVKGDFPSEKNDRWLVVEDSAGSASNQ